MHFNQNVMITSKNNYHTVKIVKINEYEVSTDKYTLYIYVATSIKGLQGLYTSARQSL